MLKLALWLQAVGQWFLRKGIALERRERRKTLPPHNPRMSDLDMM